MPRMITTYAVSDVSGTNDCEHVAAKAHKYFDRIDKQAHPQARAISGSFDPALSRKTARLDCSVGMKLSVDHVKFLPLGLADPIVSALRLYRRKLIWRRNLGRRKQLNAVEKGRPDRLNRSGYPVGGPILVVRPISSQLTRTARRCDR